MTGEGGVLGRGGAAALQPMEVEAARSRKRGGGEEGGADGRRRGEAVQGRRTEVAEEDSSTQRMEVVALGEDGKGRRSNTEDGGGGVGGGDGDRGGGGRERAEAGETGEETDGGGRWRTGGRRRRAEAARGDTGRTRLGDVNPSVAAPFVCVARRWGECGDREVGLGIYTWYKWRNFRQTLVQTQNSNPQKSWKATPCWLSASPHEKAYYLR